jgi:Polysaccharide lyase
MISSRALGAAACLSSVFVVMVSIAGARPPRAAPVYVADFETGDFSQVVSQQETTPDRITLTTSAPLQGAYSELAKVGPGDYVAGGIRAEVTLPTFSALFAGASLEGKETWVTWDERLDPNFEVAGWAILTQFHGGEGSPVFAIQANGPPPGQLVVAVRGGPANGNRRVVRLQKPLQRGVRLQFKVYHRWSTGSRGHVRVWVNGRLKATIDGPNLYAGYENTPFQKAGIYRGGVNPTRESQAWIDDIRWSRSDPGASGRPPPMHTPSMHLNAWPLSDHEFSSTSR